MTGRPRHFGAWYASTLAASGGAIALLHTCGVPDDARAEIEPTDVVIAIPPKPDTRAEAEGPGTGDVYSWERCAALPPSYADTCFSALARQRAERDPDGGLEACTQVSEGELRDECIADVAEGHALVDVGRSRGICASIEHPKWRDQCVFGIAMAWSLEDTAFALETCEASGRWIPFCKHDVNGERSVVDPPGAVAYCATLAPALREFCVHGVGKYIGRVDVTKALATCDTVPTAGDLRGQCVHGAAWAAAETQGADALSACEPLGPMRDSCVLGVAYHAKRYDPARAVDLCNQASDAGERQHCLDFVRKTRAEPARIP